MIDMKNIRKIIILLIAFIANFIIISKSHADDRTEKDKILDLVTSANKIPVANESGSPEGDVLVRRSSTGFEGEGASRVQNFEEKLRLTKNLERFVAFNPSADALYPGALVQGSSLPDGVLSPIATQRSPLSITVTDLVGENPDAVYSETVKEPNHASVRAATSRIISQNLSKAQPAKISYSQISANTIEQGFLSLGVSHKWLSGNVSGSFSKESNTKLNSVMVRIVQSYYTVSAEAPYSPVSMFGDNAKYDDFKYYANADNPPAYISSVTYGRELWLLVQSNYKYEDIRFAIKASYNAGIGGGNANVNAQQKEVLDNSSIQVMLLGGGGTPAVEVLTGDKLSGIQRYLIDGANFSKTSPGIIISYTVRYLKDNTLARVSSTLDYTIKTSERVAGPFKLISSTVTWKTTGDDKDWNTQPVVEIRDNLGVKVAQIGCCSSDRNSDDWDKGRSETRNLDIVAPATNISLAKGRFSATARPVGSDNWDYTVTVKLNFEDGYTALYSCSGRMNCSQDW